MTHKLFDAETLSSFCLELHLSFQAGISLQEGVLLIGEDEQNPAVAAVFKTLYEHMDDGMGMADAFAAVDAFPEYMLNMLRIAEQTGKHDVIFKSLSQYYIRQKNIADAIKRAVFFPSVLFVVMLVIIGVLLVKVLPIFNEIFAQMGSAMPPLALVFLDIGLAIGANGGVLLGLLAVLLGAACLVYFVPSLRSKWVQFKNKFAGKTRLGLLIGRARFTSAMALSMASGVDMDTALAMSEALCQGTVMALRVKDCREKLEQGESFINSITASNLLEPLYSRMLSVGVKTGTADAVIEEIANRCEDAANTGIEQTISKIEPIFVVVMSLLIGMVLLSVMLPMMSIMTSL